jgi:hypothetical protein
MPSDIETVDHYLTKWDEFAQGANALVPMLNQERPAFEAALSRLLEVGDRRAPARLVFSAVVQVGGTIPADSDLGRAAMGVLGAEFPVITRTDGQRVLFAADLFEWWERNRGAFLEFSLFEAWASRSFAQQAVIPMYRKLTGEEPT